MTREELEGSIRTVIETVEGLPAPTPDAKMVQAAAVIGVALLGEALGDLKRIADALDRLTADEVAQLLNDAADALDPEKQEHP